MFTGLITEIGTIAASRRKGNELTLSIACGYPAAELVVGESIACSGACLTVVACRMNGHGAQFDVQLSNETVSRTAPRWHDGAKLNLERSLSIGDRLGGHFVSGHVDGLARVFERTEAGDCIILGLEAEPGFYRFIPPKGSITLDGVSLTVNRVEGARPFRKRRCRFWVNIIPHTLSATTLGERKVGDVLNLEIDTIARYLEQLMCA